MGKPRRVVTVSAQGKAVAVPDELTVSLGVTVRAATAREALSQANERTRAAIAAFKEGGVEERDLATADLTIWPEYGETRRVDAYQARNTLSVRLRDLAQAGGLLDAVAGVVGDDIVINGLTFAVSEPEPVLTRARAQAMAAARAKAEELAAAEGARVGKVLTIDEGGGGLAPVFAPKAARLAMAAESAPIEAGEHELQVSVTVSYRLTA
jgi:uncharacterized protein YggE